VEQAVLLATPAVVPADSFGLATASVSETADMPGGPLHGRQIATRRDEPKPQGRIDGFSD